ncbi:MAG: hypothetical protein FWC19_04715 [Treponema sp.]|nr:hypothetical protein [Treponema sp.]MCL2272091.1 hypothetical protein [Treponema sp.]
MIKNRFFKGMLCVLLVFGFITVSCTTSVDVKSNLAGEYNMIPKIAGKDFIILGHVNIKTQVEYSVSPFRFVTKTEGERVTFDTLINEARRLYPNASDIINVRIDTVDKSSSISPFFIEFFTGKHSTIEYYANALVIQYTTSLPEGESPISGDTGTIPSGTTSGEKKGFLNSIFGVFGL